MGKIILHHKILFLGAICRKRAIIHLEEPMSDLEVEGLCLNPKFKNLFRAGPRDRL